MTALPSVEECGLEHQGSSVWKILLQAEETALLEPVSCSTARYNHPLVAIRTVGFFLKDFWDHAEDGYLGSQPYVRLLEEIRSCLRHNQYKERYDALVELGRLYQSYLMRVFRSNAGGRHTPSEHPSRPSFDVVRDRILEELNEEPKTKGSARKRALLRDGYRCALSGLYDTQSCFNMEEIDAACQASTYPTSIDTEVAHIFSESAQDGDKNYAATVFAILSMFGLKEKAKSLYGASINGLHNVITMAHDLHTQFDRFNLWLEPVPGQANAYDVCGKAVGRLFVPVPRRVIFSVEPGAAAAAAAMGKELKLPDPGLIAIRAACARVANLSGAAEQMDRILRDMEDMTVLANDGSMAEVLSSRISTLIPRAVDVSA